MLTLECNICGSSFQQLDVEKLCSVARGAGQRALRQRRRPAGPSQHRAASASLAASPQSCRGRCLPTSSPSQRQAWQAKCPRWRQWEGRRVLALGGSSRSSRSTWLGATWPLSFLALGRSSGGYMSAACAGGLLYQTFFPSNSFATSDMLVLRCHLTTSAATVIAPDLRLHAGVLFVKRAAFAALRIVRQPSQRRGGFVFQCDTTDPPKAQSSPVCKSVKHRN